MSSKTDPSVIRMYEETEELLNKDKSRFRTNPVEVYDFGFSVVKEIFQDGDQYFTEKDPMKPHVYHQVFPNIVLLDSCRDRIRTEAMERINEHLSSVKKLRDYYDGEQKKCLENIAEDLLATFERIKTDGINQYLTMDGEVKE